MTLSSFKFVVFLAAVTIIYFLLPKKIRKFFLLISNYIFYMLWQPAFGLLLLAGTTVTFLCARAYEIRFLHRGKLWIVLGQLYLFGLLFLYKYLEFFCSVTLGLAGVELSIPELVLPIGISFYTFSASAYLFDVYRGKIPAEHSIIYFAVFLSFFPSILSGPINRAQSLLPQIRESCGFDYLRFKQGLLRFAVGAVKKLVLADTLAIYINAVYSDVSAYSGTGLALAAVMYSLQIYFDFAGYTDMALGAAKILGFELCENFKAPYLARNIKDFWKRWHISLTSWFRDYLYFPMGGSRVSKARTYFNVMVVFAVSGLWHGAAMNFVVWGLLNGLYQVIGQVLLPARLGLHKALHIKEDSRVLVLIQIAFTFALSTLAWIFFRAASLSEAVYIIRQIALSAVNGISGTGILSTLSIKQIAMVAFCLAVFTVQDIFCICGKKLPDISEHSFRYWLVLSFIAVFICIFGVYGEGFDPQAFVYFRF